MSDAALSAAQPETGAELSKLAHALGVDPTRLEMLAAVPVADLRTLRQQIGEALFQADRHHFTRVAALSKAVPVAVAAKLTEAALPPSLAARTTELLDPRRTVDLVARISDRYLADVAAAMDPARSPEVIGAIPPERVATIGAELARRQEWVVMGAFVSVVGPGALAASIAGLDGEQLLRIGFVVEDPSRLDVIGGLLSDGQRDQLLDAAADHSLWLELAEIVGHLSDRQRAVLAEQYASGPAPRRAAFEQAVADGWLPAEVLATLA